MNRLKKLLLAVLAISLILTLSGCQSAAPSAAPASAPTATPAPTPEPTPEPLAEYVPIDWDTVPECAADSFTYELFEALDPDTYDAITGVRLLTYTGTETIVKIPDRIEGCLVRESVDSLFAGNTAVTHVSLPVWLRVYGRDYSLKSMFQGCTSLQEVRMPLSTSHIAHRMFDGCTALRQVTFRADETHPLALREIGIGSFAGCTSLTSVEFPASLEVIEDQAFSGCTQLTQVKAPGAYRWGDNVFLDCAQLTSLEMCSGTNGSGYDAPTGLTFAGCSALDSITLVPAADPSAQFAKLVCENGLLYIVDNEGTEDQSVVLTCILPGATAESPAFRADLIGIDRYAIYGCGIKELIIPAGIVRLPHYAIRNCQRLEIIRAAEGSQLREIATEAIAFCPALKTIDFSTVSAEAQIPAEFDRCPALENMMGPQ